jgi:hypothetical protein
LAAKGLNSMRPVQIESATDRKISSFHFIEVLLRIRDRRRRSPLHGRD